MLYAKFSNKQAVTSSRSKHKYANQGSETLKCELWTWQDLTTKSADYYRILSNLVWSLVIGIDNLYLFHSYWISRPNLIHFWTLPSLLRSSVSVVSLPMSQANWSYIDLKWNSMWCRWQRKKCSTAYKLNRLRPAYLWWSSIVSGKEWNRLACF